MRQQPLLLALLLAAVPTGHRLPPSAPLALDPDPGFAVADSVLAQLSVVSDLALDPDGSLYLADALFPAVLHLERDGTLRRILGRGGSGPGEFSRLFQVGVTRDSLWVIDSGLLRVTLFPRDGRGQAMIPYGRGRQADRPGQRSPQIEGTPVVMLPDGGFLVHVPEAADGSSRGAPVRMVLLRTDRDFVVRDTVTILPFDHSVLRFVYREGESHMREPFGDDPTVGNASDGSLIVEVERPAARRAVESQFTVRAWRDGQQPIWTRRISYQPARLTNRLVDSLAVLYTTPIPGQPRSPLTADSIRRRVYRPLMLPPVEQVVVGRDRSIWLRVHFADSPAGRADWMLLSPNGFPLRRVSTDPRFKLLEVERNSLWGVMQDPNDVPRMVRYRVPPGR